MNIFISRGVADDDQQLVRYALGLLPDKDAERLDEDCIADDELAARLRAVETDLVDAYVCGTLEGELRDRFETWYLASARRRDKVKFARQFLNAVDRLPTAATAATAATSSVTSLPGRVSQRPLFFWLASAAALVLACGALLLHDVRLQRGLLDARHDGAALDQHGRELAQQLGDERLANETLRKQVEGLRTAQPLALVLRPDTRAAAQVSVIAVPSGLDTVAFELELEANDSTQYEVALKEPSTNRVVWRSGVVKPSASRRTPAVAVAVPASVLRPQHYSLELSGRSSGAGFTVVGSYAFQVEAR